MTEYIRKHMVIYGNVQGVGFRFRAKHAAEALRITGWVKNNWDGFVELEVQGTDAQINDMMKYINRSDYIRLDRIESKIIDLDEAEKGFHVR